MYSTTPECSYTRTTTFIHNCILSPSYSLQQQQQPQLTGEEEDVMMEMQKQKEKETKQRNSPALLQLRETPKVRWIWPAPLPSLSSPVLSKGTQLAVILIVIC